MKAEELRAYVDSLGVPRGQISDYLGVDYRTMSRWLSGESPVPRMVEIIVKNKAIKVKTSEVVVKKKQLDE